MDTIKFPITYDGTGLTKLVEDSDAYIKQLLSLCARTEPGVSPLYPDFGVYDPTFLIADKGQFMIQAARYIPEIQVTNVETIFSQDGESSTAIEFVRRT